MRFFEISDERLQDYLSRAGKKVDSRLERMARARDRLNKSYEIYHADAPNKIVHRFEANTPVEAKRYYERYNANYDSDVDYDLRLRRATGIIEGTEDYEGMQLRLSKSDDGVAIRALAGGKELGMAEFFFDNEGRLDPQTVWVDERYHGQGIARVMYDYLKNKGYTIIRSWDQTDAGKGFWDKHQKPGAKVWEDELNEGWKENLAALGLVGAAAGGVAVDDYISQKSNPQQQQAVPAVTAQATSPTPKIEIPNAIAKTDVTKSNINSLPPEKLLATVAKASGIMGNELAQLLAQAAHETLNFKHMTEIGSSKYFAKKYDPKFAPKKAKALGNTQVGDGERYKGRGFLQITGRYNYAQAGKALGLPLEQHPELMERPDVAAKAAVWYWNNRVAPKVANFDTSKATTKAVTKAINPGMKHLKQRQQKLQQYASK
jgi:predicted chitinase